MAPLVYPGVMFKVSGVETGLFRTVSNYGHGDNLHCRPRENEVYVMCKDHSIQSVFQPQALIGWELIEDRNDFFYRVKQLNQEPIKCSVFWHGRLEDIPAGVTGIDMPQCAEVIEQGGESEEEVSSV
jgi:hypothetical protein